LQAGDGDYGLGLGSKGRKRKGFALVAAADKERDERANTGGVQEIHATHIKDDIFRGFGARGGQKLVYGFQAEFAFELINSEILGTCWESFQFQFERLHNPTKVAQERRRNINRR